MKWPPAAGRDTAQKKATIETIGIDLLSKEGQSCVRNDAGALGVRHAEASIWRTARPSKLHGRIMREVARSG